MSAPSLSGDARRVLAAPALRVFDYGFGALLLGRSLDDRGFTATQVGLVLMPWSPAPCRHRSGWPGTETASAAAVSTSRSTWRWWSFPTRSRACGPTRQRTSDGSCSWRRFRDVDLPEEATEPIGPAGEPTAVLGDAA